MKIYISGKVTDNPDYFEQFNKAYACLVDEYPDAQIFNIVQNMLRKRYNKTGGGQGEGKEKINEFRPAKGYRDGIKQGKKVLARELSSIAEKHLKIEIRDDKKHNKISQKQYEKFMDLLKVGDSE